jgi:hypothetical protein
VQTEAADEPEQSTDSEDEDRESQPDEDDAAFAAQDPVDLEVFAVDDNVSGRATRPALVDAPPHREQGQIREAGVRGKLFVEVHRGVNLMQCDVLGATRRARMDACCAHCCLGAGKSDPYVMISLTNDLFLRQNFKTTVRLACAVCAAALKGRLSIRSRSRR